MNESGIHAGWSLQFKDFFQQLTHIKWLFGAPFFFFTSVVPVFHQGDEPH